jgi:hypothetical protein
MSKKRIEHNYGSIANLKDAIATRLQDMSSKLKWHNGDVCSFSIPFMLDLKCYLFDTHIVVDASGMAAGEAIRKIEEAI